MSDFPIFGIPCALAARFPTARFVYFARDFESWFESERTDVRRAREPHARAQRPDRPSAHVRTWCSGHGTDREPPRARTACLLVQVLCTWMRSRGRGFPRAHYELGLQFMRWFWREGFDLFWRLVEDEAQRRRGPACAPNASALTADTASSWAGIKERFRAIVAEHREAVHRCVPAERLLSLRLDDRDAAGKVASFLECPASVRAKLTMPRATGANRKVARSMGQPESVLPTFRFRM